MFPLESGQILAAPYTELSIERQIIPLSTQLPKVPVRIQPDSNGAIYGMNTEREMISLKLECSLELEFHAPKAPVRIRPDSNGALHTPSIQHSKACGCQGLV